MFQNYFKIAVRHLLRQNFFSAINILRLAIGITFSLIIGVSVSNQYSINPTVKSVGQPIHHQKHLVKSLHTE